MKPMEPLSITARVEIAVWCLVVVVFIASLALWVATCFKARAIRQQLKLLNTKKGSSQSIYDDISVTTNNETVPSNQATHVEDQQQGASTWSKIQHTGPDKRYCFEELKTKSYSNFHSRSLNKTLWFDTGHTSTSVTYLLVVMKII